MTDKIDISAEAVDFLKEKRDADDASFGGCKLSAPLHEYPCERDCPCALRDQVIALRTALDAAGAERDILHNAGIVEIAARNPSVMEYMKHWEGRAEAAEAREQAAVSAALRQKAYYARMLDEARREEREVCALIAENRHKEWNMPETHGLPEVTCDVTACANIATAIRARGEGDG